MIDVRGTLAANGIEFVERGRNVGPDHVGIACPLCGDDPSQHLTIHVHKGVWHCWRSAEHRGSWSGLLRLLGIQEAPPLIAPAERIRSLPRVAVHERAAKFRTYPLTEAAPFAVWRYWVGRVGQRNVQPLAQRYGVYYSHDPAWKFRLLFPQANGSMTGRAVFDHIVPRWRSAGAVKETLFDLHGVQNSSGTLVVCEGIFDAIRVGEVKGYVGTCVFGTQISDAQAVLLRDLAERFERVVLLFDQDAGAAALAIQWRMALPVEVRFCADGDPADMSEEDVLWTLSLS